MNCEKTYVDMINELRESINQDIIPEEEKVQIILYINIIADMLWKYSD